MNVLVKCEGRTFIFNTAKHMMTYDERNLTFWDNGKTCSRNFSIDKEQCQEIEQLVQRALTHNTPCFINIKSV